MASVDADVEAETPPRPTSAAGWVLGVFVATIVLDQATKEWAVRALTDEPGQMIDVVGTLRWNLVRNYGASFSSFEGGGRIISVIAVVVAVATLVIGARQSRRVLQVLYALVAGGAIGNVIDRQWRRLPGEGFLEGGVVDFVDVQFWPVWNVADMAVVCSAIALIGISLFDDWRAGQATAGPSESAEQAAQSGPSESAEPAAPSEPTDADEEPAS